MNIKAARWAMQQPELVGSSARFVLVALCCHADAEGWAWTKLATLSADTEMSVTTLQRSLRVLEAHGLVSRKHRTGTVDQYCIHFTEARSDRPDPPRSDRPDQSGHSRLGARSSTTKSAVNESDIEEMELMDKSMGARSRVGASENGVAAPAPRGGDTGPESTTKHDCANGWVYNAKSDGVYPCPVCRPVQYRDTIGAPPPSSTTTRRRDLE